MWEIKWTDFELIYIFTKEGFQGKSEVPRTV